MAAKKTPPTVRVVDSLGAYTDFLSSIWNEPGTIFRGQPVRAKLLPRVARNSGSTDTLTIEKEMLIAFKQRSIPHLRFRPDNEWEWLALAQHHGLPTRLLDWTANPLVGLWFAVETGSRHKEDMEVWALKPESADFVGSDDTTPPFGQRRTKIYQPSHLTPRIIAQAGWFTVHKYMTKQQRFFPLETIAVYKDRLSRIQIPSDRCSAIKKDLDRWGLNREMLFPDLDGICRHLAWQHGF